MPTRYTKAYTNGDSWSIPETTAISIDLTASSVDSNIFVADVPMEVVAVREVHSVVGGASAAVGLTKCTGTTAPGSGTAITVADFDLTATVNTNQNKTLASGLATTAATRKLAVGDRLGLNFSGTLTGLVGVVTVFLRKLQTPGADR